jgi:short-subunit dehydrogenase
MAKTGKTIITKPNGSALITGASKGIGRAFAIECAKRGFNLALVSLPDSGLVQIKNYINKYYSVTVKSFEIDLSSPKAPQKLYDWTKEENIKVQILINNAGLGHLGSFTDYSYEFYEKIIRLNIESVVLLTKLFIPVLKEQPKGYILNLGSLASFYPIPYKIVYAGSKSFIYSFSRALKSEMRETSVNVSVLCPGPIVTSPEVIARIKQGGFWGRISSMRAQKMARISLNALFREKAVIIPGKINKCLRIVNNIIPNSLKQRLLAKKFNVNGEAVFYNELKTKEKTAKVER